MKKYLFALLMCVVAFASCSKDDDDYSPSIKGTLWKCYTGEADFTWEITFITENEARATLTSEIIDKAQTFMYDYSYNHPIILMQGKGNAADLKGEIGQDGKMTITNVSTQKEIGIFTKQ